MEKVERIEEIVAETLVTGVMLSLMITIVETCDVDPFVNCTVHLIPIIVYVASVIADTFTNLLSLESFGIWIIANIILILITGEWDSVAITLLLMTLIGVFKY